MGSGDFGAPRGNRKHNGRDYKVNPGDDVYSHVSGVVTKIGFPYAQTGKTKKDALKAALRYVEVTDSITRLKHRFFYIDSAVKIGDPISKGTLIGSCQNLLDIWPSMTNHVHYEVKDDGGNYIDPGQFW